MAFKNILKKVARRIPNKRVLQYFPRGLDPFIDLKVALPDYQVDTFFDVGANVGQSAIDYVSEFPTAHIYSFEPVSATYHQLCENSRQYQQIHCYRYALSSQPGQGEVLAQSTALDNHLIREESTVKTTADTEQVEIITLDSFCQTESLERISYLKVDTEGEDFNVLKGAEQMLEQQRIDFVELEAGMHDNNQFHVPFEELKSFLEQYRYFLFGIYVQTAEFYEQKPYLRRVNPLFISNDIVEENPSLI